MTGHDESRPKCRRTYTHQQHRHDQSTLKSQRKGAFQKNGGSPNIRMIFPHIFSPLHYIASTGRAQECRHVRFRSMIVTRIS
eukprot:scaffold17552_cov249-Cylindrotheca_fusiformis.AAC.1